MCTRSTFFYTSFSPCLFVLLLRLVKPLWLLHTATSEYRVSHPLVESENYVNRTALLLSTCCTSFLCTHILECVILHPVCVCHALVFVPWLRGCLSAGG